MRFGILGPLEVLDDHGRPLSVSARKQRALLAILLLHPNEVIAADRLMEDLWAGAPPPSAAKGLQVHVSRLRRALAAAAPEREERLFTEGSGYVLRVGTGELDSERFAGLVHEAGELIAAGRFGLAADKLGESLALWRGAVLSDFEYEEFAQAEIQRLSELRVVAVEQRIAAELELGSAELLIGELERLVREHPYRERLRGHLMLALYRSGRQAEALQAYRDARAVLVDELGIEPSVHLRELHDAILTQDASLASPRRRDGRDGPTNLPPQPRALVGRTHELRELRRLLMADSGQIVTITGIGGCGKTRLALAVAHELLDDFPGGVFLVRLAGVSDVDSIVPMIAEALGVTGQAEASLPDLVAQRLAERPTLLILDNFEHLLAGAPLLSHLIERARGLCALVTSQVALRIRPERTVPLGPLAPDDAATLFVERARAVVPEFAPAPEDRSAIEGICTRLEFMPLGIELAAARVGLFGPRQLEQRLERPLSVLKRGDRDAPERQRSLRATIEWTHGLLDPASRALFARLGACVGAVPPEVVEAVAGDDGSPDEVLDQLEQLLEFSFVRRQEDRFGIRFVVPQALRDYALEQLVAAGEEDRVRRLHAELVARVAHAARPWKWGATPQQRIALLAVADEIRPAVAWARARDPELHVRMCAALCSYWAFRGVLSEATEELESALESEVGAPSERAWILTLLAKYAQLKGDRMTSEQLADQLIAQWSYVEHQLERAIGLFHVCWVLAWEDQFQEAIDTAREALAVVRGTGDQSLILRGLARHAQVLVDAGDAAAAEAVLAEADELAGGDPSWELTTIHADCAMLKGDNATATQLYADSLAWSNASGESHQVLMDMSALGTSLARLGEGEAALEVLELHRLEAQRTGRAGDNLFGPWELEARTSARLAVDSATAERAAARARALPLTRRADRAIEIAQAVTQRPRNET